MKIGKKIICIVLVISLMVTGFGISAAAADPFSIALGTFGMIVTFFQNAEYLTDKILEFATPFVDGEITLPAFYWLPIEYNNYNPALRGVTLSFETLSDACYGLNQSGISCSMRTAVFKVGSSTKTYWVLMCEDSKVNAQASELSLYDFVGFVNPDGRLYCAPYSEGAAGGASASSGSPSSTTTEYHYYTEGDKITNTENNTTTNNYYSGDTINDPIYKEGDYYEGDTIDQSGWIYDYRTGEFIQADALTYDYSTKTYTTNATYQEGDTYVDNSVHIQYHIDYTSITYIGASEEYEVFNLYYELPDGRSSADLTAEDLEQLNVNFDVINYGVSADDGRLQALYHFDGNTEDSSYWTNYGSFDWVTGASITYLESNSFNGCLYLDEGAHQFDVTLPKNLSASDFTIQFRLYQSATTNTVNNLTLSAALVSGDTSSTWYTSNNTNFPVGTWNEVALIREGGTLYTYLNGVVTGSAAVSDVYGSVLSFVFSSGAQTYRYFDELRVYNFALYEGGVDYTPTAVPVDTNAVLVLPDSAFPIPDGYWEFNTEGNLLPYYDFTNGVDSSVIGDRYCYLSSTIEHSFCYSPSSASSSCDYFVFTDSSLLGVGTAGDSSYSYFSSEPSHIYANSPLIPLHLGSGYSPYSLVSNTVYTFSFMISSGDLYSVTFTTPSAMSYGYASSSYEDGSCVDVSYDWGVLRYSHCGFSSGQYRPYLFIEFFINDGTTLDIVYMELVEGDTPNTGHKYVTEVYSSEELTGPTIAVRSQIPVRSYRVGGVRPTVPYRGDVWLMIEDNRITSCQIYNGFAWTEADCRIWTGSRWVSPVYYNMLTQQDYSDITGTTDNVYIQSSEGFYAWITQQFKELFDLLNTIISELKDLDTGLSVTAVNLEFTIDESTTINLKKTADDSRDGGLKVLNSLWDIVFDGVFDEATDTLGDFVDAFGLSSDILSPFLDAEEGYTVFAFDRVGDDIWN